MNISNKSQIDYLEFGRYKYKKINKLSFKRKKLQKR